MRRMTFSLSLCRCSLQGSTHPFTNVIIYPLCFHTAYKMTSCHCRDVGFKNPDPYYYFTFQTQLLFRFRKLLHRKKKVSQKKNAAQTVEAGTSEEGSSKSEDAGTSQPRSKTKRKSKQSIPSTSTSQMGKPPTSTTSMRATLTCKTSVDKVVIKDSLESVQSRFDDIELCCPKSEDMSDFEALLQHCESRIKGLLNRI